MDKYKINLFDSKTVIAEKQRVVFDILNRRQEELYEKECVALKEVIDNIGFCLPREEFSCKNGILIYEFKHSDIHREVFISPEVYILGDKILYEVIKPKDYYEVTTNEILISDNNKYFCEIPLKQFLQYVSLEEIINYILDYINDGIRELKSIDDRMNFLSKIKSNDF